MNQPRSAPHDDRLAAPSQPAPTSSSRVQPATAGPALWVVDDALFYQHRARGYHPERPERLVAARHGVDQVAALGLPVQRLDARDATAEELARAHAPEYLEALSHLRGHHGSLDPDTYVVPVSVDAAVRAAGGAMTMVDALLAAPADAGAPGSRIGMALLRPPGHHATRRTGMGFCLLNNVAIAARSALERGLSRVAIVDFDVHHGNGTQDIFWRDPEVLFISLHQSPFYPGTGSTDEAGEGAGAGYTVNIPLTEGATDAVYEAAFKEIVMPILDEYAPELILVSAGYDAHERDPLSSMKVTRAGYASMVRELSAAASAKARGRLGLVLEGGYDLAALEASVAASLLAATGRWPGAGAGSEDEGVPESWKSVSARHRVDLDRARRAAMRRWVTL